MVPTLTDTRICVLLTEVGATAVLPVQFKTTFSEDWNPLPAMVSGWLELDAGMGLGLSETIVGGGVTLDQ